jgi:hypothetical protein
MRKMIYDSRRLPGVLVVILCLVAAARGDSPGAVVAKRPEAQPVQALSGPGKDPLDYVVDKLRRCDLVLIGETHWVHQDPLFLEQLVARCMAENLIDVVFLEIGRLEEQGKIDAFMKSPTYDPTPVIEILRDETLTGWGYQEYLDIFRRIYEENAKREPSRRVRLVMVDPEFDEVDLWSYFDKHLKQADLPDGKRRSVAGSLNDAITDRDRVMADVIESCRYELGLSRGIFYGGAAHVRKDLKQKDYGRRHFAVGGLLARHYPGRVCCLALQQGPERWQCPADAAYLEQLFQGQGKPFAVDTNDPALDRLRFKSTVAPEGVRLSEAYDGYLMLSPGKDRRPCHLIPGFYTDDFAKVVWERARKRGLLPRLPEPYSQWREKTPTGAELGKMVEEGLH